MEKRRFVAEIVGILMWQFAKGYWIFLLLVIACLVSGVLRVIWSNLCRGFQTFISDCKLDDVFTLPSPHLCPTKPWFIGAEDGI